MESKNKKQVNAEMPETIFSSETAIRVKDAAEDILSDLHYAIQDLRGAGVPIETMKDLNGISVEAIKSQLDKDKESYFKNMRFVPSGLRRQVNQEFAEMERTFLPLAEKLVKARQRIPVPVTLNFQESYKTGEYCVEYDPKELEDYITKSSTFHILPEYREYYNAISDFCKAWERLQGEADRLKLEQPKGSLIKALMDGAEVIGGDGNVYETFGIQSKMSITPEKMYRLIRYDGIIRPQTADEKS
jgi:hypothetical protein